MAGLWRNDEGTREGKYLVKRRDGTIPPWAWFVLGEGDPAAPAALRAYADAAAQCGMDPKYVADVRQLATEWQTGQIIGAIPIGDPDAGRHRTDDPATVGEMRRGPVRPVAIADLHRMADDGCPHVAEVC